MRLIKAKLRGFIGIKEGLGLDEVEINFEGMCGLVALQGANGMGKTTLLENLQPYRVLPSRSGTLKSHCFLKDSYKELIFEMNGVRYRTLIKSDPTTTRSDEGYIYRNNEQSSLVDSKVSNYDAFIEDLLGSPGLFFSSIFCAQNSRKLSDMRPAELKALFAEFLRLDRYVQWEDTAKSAIRICHAGSDALDQQEHTLDTKVRMMGDPRGDLKGARKLLKTAVSEGEAVGNKLRAAEKAKEELKKAVIESELQRQRIKDHDKLLTDLSDAQIAADKQHEWAKIDSEMTLMDLETKLKEKKEILKDEPIIRGAVEGLDMAEKLLADLRATRDQHNTARHELANRNQRIEANLLQSRNKVKGLVHEPQLIALQDASRLAATNADKIKEKIQKIDEDLQLVKMQAEIESRQRSAAVLDGIDPGCTSEVCGLIAESIKARDTLPDIQSQLIQLRKSKLKNLEMDSEKAITVHVAAKDDCQCHMAAQDKIKENELRLQSELEARYNENGVQITKHQTCIKQNETEIGNIEVKIAEYKRLAVKLPQLVVAEDMRKVLEKDIAKEKTQICTHIQAYDAQKQERLKQMQKAQDVIDSIKINFEAEKQLAEVEKELGTLLDEKREIEADKYRWQTAISRYEKEIEDLTALEAELSAIRKKKVWVNGQTAEWDYLRLACSKDGMRAHEVEAVAPVITQNSNDLLSLTFGPNYSVRFETQDEDGREVLNIIVISADGSETPLHLKSGGEKVWILKALRLAQTLISQEKSGRHFQTALMDEEDGALSADNAISFIKLYRSFQTMAKMDLCLYITHRPEAVAMADSILRFAPGRLSIV